MNSAKRALLIVIVVALCVSIIPPQTTAVRADEPAVDEVAELKARVQRLEKALKQRNEKIALLEKLVAKLHAIRSPKTPNATRPQFTTPKLTPKTQLMFTPDGQLLLTPIQIPSTVPTSRVPAQTVPQNWIPRQINGLTFYIVPCESTARPMVAPSLPPAILLPQRIPGRTPAAGR
jgi:hypothetical protein